MSDPAIKTPNLEHQQQIYDRAKDEDYFALFWEMGLGKTKLMIDVASHLFLKKKIDALLILAPKSVYTNWLTTEIPAHMAVPYLPVRYKSHGSEEQRARRLLILDPDWKKDHLRVVAMNYDALRTKDGEEFARKFCLIYRVMIVADESTILKNPSSQTAKIAKRIRSKCHYAWIATGTPAAQSPFDVHSQVEFLDPDFWATMGMRSHNAFKNQFAVFGRTHIGGGKTVPKLEEYRNLDKLHKLLDLIGHRLLKEDSTIKLPPKMYSVKTFEMEPSQRKTYEELREEFLVESAAPEFYLEAALAVVRLTRLQQIASGFVTAMAGAVDDETTQDGEMTIRGWGHEMPLFDQFHAEIKPRFVERKIVDIVPPKENPRLALLLYLLDNINHKVIVWCRFRRSVELICEALGDRAVRFDGSTRDKDREENLRLFKDPDSRARVFVANIAAISMGVTLNIAKTAIYYENTFSLEKRLQSEDRFHRIGQDQSVHIIDIAAEGTVDERLIEALKKKYEIAAKVTGDRFREWIK